MVKIPGEKNLNGDFLPSPQGFWMSTNNNNVWYFPAEILVLSICFNA